MNKKSKEPFIEDEEFPVPINELDVELRTQCSCSDITILNWIKRYTVFGKEIGVKVGGQWRVYPSRLRAFLKGQSVPKLR